MCRFLCFVHWFVTTVPLFLKLGEMMYQFKINHRQGNSKNIIPLRLHSAIFKMARRGKLLCYPLHHVRFLRHPWLPFFDETWRNDAPHLFEKKKLHFLAKRGSYNYSSKHGDMFLTDCPSFVGGEKTRSLSPRLSFVSRSLSAVSSADTAAARHPSPLHPSLLSPLPHPSPCHKLLHQAPH